MLAALGYMSVPAPIRVKVFLFLTSCS